jgi:hypothetical protein
MGVIIGEETAYPSSSASVISGVRFHCFSTFLVNSTFDILHLQVPLEFGYISIESSQLENRNLSFLNSHLCRC